MTKNQLDALVNDAIFKARAALYQLEQLIARDREAIDRLEAKGAEGILLNELPDGLVATRAVAELRLLVQLRRQAGRFVDDSEQHDGSDY